MPLKWTLLSLQLDKSIFQFRPKENKCLVSGNTSIFFRVGRLAILFFFIVFLHRKSMKIIQNTLKIEEKFSDVPIFFRVGPKKVGSVGFPETRIFFFLALRVSGVLFCLFYFNINPCMQTV